MFIIFCKFFSQEMHWIKADKQKNPSSVVPVRMVDAQLFGLGLELYKEEFVDI